MTMPVQDEAWSWVKPYMNEVTPQDAESHLEHGLQLAAMLEMESEAMTMQWLGMPLKRPLGQPRGRKPTVAEANVQLPEVGEEECEEDDARAMTEEQVAAALGEVENEIRESSWRTHTTGVLQSRCFAVEWRGTNLLDRKEFMRRLLRVVGKAPFVLGTEKRKSRADYLVVVRLQGRARLRDWRKALLFGHDGEGEEEGLFMRVRVPHRATDAGINAFVHEMVQKCESYCEVSRHRSAELSRTQARPGRGHAGGRAEVDANAD